MTERRVLLQTERLAITQWCPNDAGALCRILSDPTTMRAWPRPFERPEVDEYIARWIASYPRGTGRYALIVRSNDTTVGDAGLVWSKIENQEVLDLGYIVHYPFWRRGFAFEAAQALLSYAFGVLHVTTVHAHMAADNVASLKLAEKLGMRLDRELPWERDRGKLHRVYVIEDSYCPAANSAPH